MWGVAQTSNWRSGNLEGTCWFNWKSLLRDNEGEGGACATVNKQGHGGKKSGAGVGKARDTSSSRKGGRLGGRAASQRPASERSRSAKKAAATRRARGH